MSSSRRQVLLLMVLVVSFLALLAQRFATFDGGVVFGGGRGPDFSAALRAEVSALELERLSRAGGEYTPGRDPWRFAEPPPPPRQEPLPVVQPMRVEPELAPPVAAVPPRPQPPAIDVQYLGRFGPKMRPIAVFVDQDGQTLYNMLEGDVLKGKFQVAQIGLESVQIAFVGFPDAPPARLAVHGAGR
ncbi:MAG TPA: hypothetical protein VNB06_18475 [Thermoanaerobaculia bacterium]|nr:hypothetical protein [Thermoanaerobaculia bacterium]